MEKLQGGDKCPDCGKGSLCQEKGRQQRLVVLHGNPMFYNVAYKREVLSCSTCKGTFKADLSQGVKPGKAGAHDAIAMAGISRYLMGLPHYRVAVYHKLLGCRVPTSTLFDMSVELCDALLPVFDGLVDRVREVDLVGADDSRMTILSLINGEEGKRKTGRVTGVRARTREGNRIVLYKTGDQIASEFLDELLEFRTCSSPLILMADALAANNPTNDEVPIKRAKCLTHARRNFYEELDNNGSIVLPILKTMGKVWAVEKRCKKEGITGRERMMLHRKESASAMVSLYLEAKKKIKEKELEPVTDLYKAYAYFLRHWKGLTLFLREPDCDIDNNETERMLKRAILHRKNSMFYRCLFGAKVGDVIMSVGFSALQNGVDPFTYFIDLLHHKGQVRKDIERFLPWNWEQHNARAGPSDFQPEQIPLAA